MTPQQIIRSNRERVGIETDMGLAEAIGMSYSTYSHQRMSNPQTFRLYELQQIIKVTGMADEDILALVRGQS